MRRNQAKRGSNEHAGNRPGTAPPRRRPHWVTGLLAIAVFCVIGGIGLHAWAVWSADSTPPPSAPSATTTEEALPDDATDPAPSDPAEDDRRETAQPLRGTAETESPPAFRDLFTHGLTDFNTRPKQRRISSVGAMQPDSLLPRDDPPPAAPRESEPADTDEADESRDPVDLSRLESWSPMIFRLGFSFLIGFAIAYAARKFLKVVILIIGALALVVFGLQYSGVIDVDWTRLESVYDVVMPWLREQTASFARFITGYLPSTLSAASGLLIGFRRW